jgi:hypothetical protein
MTAIQTIAEINTSNFIVSWLWISMINCSTSSPKNCNCHEFLSSSYSEVTRCENLKTNLTSYERFNSYSGDYEHHQLQTVWEPIGRWLSPVRSCYKATTTDEMTVDTSVCVIVKCKVWARKVSRSPINRVISPKTVYSYSNTWQY